MIFKENDIGAADKQDLLFLDQLNQKLCINPYDYNVLLQKALLFSRPFYRSDKAAEVFELLIKLYPHDYYVYFWYGLSEYVDVGNEKKAFGLLRKAIAIDPAKADAYIILAEVTKFLNNDEKAIEACYTKAQELEPYWPKSWYGQIYLFRRQQRFADTKATIEKALQHVPKDFVDSQDLIQGRHDWVVSGRDWSRIMEADMKQYLQEINEEEAILKNDTSSIAKCII